MPRYYHRLTPEQKEWAEAQLNKRARLSNRKNGMAIDYKPDLSGIGIYLQVLVPTVRAALGDPEYQEVWRAFPKEIATRQRPMTRGDMDETYLQEYVGSPGEDEGVEEVG